MKGKRLEKKSNRGFLMKNEIQKILKTIQEERLLNAKMREEIAKDRALNSERHKDFVEERDLNSIRYNQLNESLKEERESLKQERNLNIERFKSFNQLWKAFVDEQSLNAQRYNELKGSIDQIISKMATKDQLNQVFESLSQDITFVSGGHHKLKKRVTLLEKRVEKLEDRVV